MTLHLVPPAPEPAKRLTITMTNRAPFIISEDEWPVLALGVDSYEVEGAPYEWRIEVCVRENKGKTFTGMGWLIHANYRYFEDDCPGWYQTINVGRLVGLADWRLWQHIAEVGEEMRERIIYKKMRKNLTFALDACFAGLPAQDR